MSNVISIQDYKARLAVKAYTAYYGVPVEVVKVKKSFIKAVEQYTEDDIAQLQGSIDMSNYLEWLTQQEDVDLKDIEVIKPDPSIPW